MGKYNLSTRKLIQILEKNGFIFIRQNGSHAIFKNPQKSLKVVVPIHTKNIPTGTALAILKDAGPKHLFS